MNRKVAAILNDEKGIMPKVKAKPKGTLPSESDIAKKKAQDAKKSFTGLIQKGAIADREKVGEGNLRMLSIDGWMQNLDKQVMYMEKTDQDLINRMKTAEEEKKEIFRQEEINKAY